MRHIAVAQSEKAETKKALEALLASAQKAGRELTPAESETYNRGMATIKACNVEIQSYSAAIGQDIERPDGRREGRQFDANRAQLQARRREILSNLGPFFRPGGRTADIRNDAGTDFQVSDGEVFIPSEVVSAIVEVAAVFDVFEQLEGHDFPRSSINPITVPVLAEPTVVGTVSELSDPGSVIPTLTPVTLGGTKELAYSTMSWETIASLMAQLNNPMLQNEQLSQAVIRGIQLGILKQQNSKFITKLYSDLSGNSHASYFNTYGSNTLIDIIGDLQSTLALQFRPAAKFLLGQPGQKVLQQAVDTLGRRLFPEMPDMLSGKPVVISADISDTSIFYGDFSLGAYRSKSPLILRTLIEAKATEGATAYLGVQWSDFGTFAKDAPSTVQQPILMTGLQNGGS